MSGIAGWVDPAGLPDTAGVIERMTASLRHRARGGERTWHEEMAAFGATGQSACIADLAPGAPLVLLDGYVANDDGLDDGGTGSWEALLARRYQRHDRAFVRDVAGGFAVALWDAPRRRLMLARDPLGLKPLYYARVGKGLVFGSEPKALFAHPGVERRLDLQRLDILLQPRLADADETPLAGIAQVKPGHVVEFGPAVVTEHRYWSLESCPHYDDYPATVGRVRALLDDAVTGALRGADRAAAMLSGGLDSTGVTALADPGRIDSFCVRFAGDVEDFAASSMRPDIDAPFAAEAAAWLGTNHREVVLSTDQLIAAIPATRAARDLPAWGQFDASMHCLFGEMAQGHAIGISGEAADELFGGYPFFHDPAAVVRDDFPWLGSGAKLTDFLTADADAAIAAWSRAPARYRRLVEHSPRLDGEHVIDARQRELFHLSMQGPLTVVVERKDRMSAAWGLDMRLPFCDHRLVNYVWNVPWRFKAQNGVKGLLKDALRDILPPVTLARRKSAYPHVQSDLYHQTLIDETLAIAAGTVEGARLFFAPDALRSLVAQFSAATARDVFPGGSDPRYMLVHIVELHRWMLDYRIAA